VLRAHHGGGFCDEIYESCWIRQFHHRFAAVADSTSVFVVMALPGLGMNGWRGGLLAVLWVVAVGQLPAERAPERLHLCQRRWQPGGQHCVTKWPPVSERALLAYRRPWRAAGG